MVPPSLGWVFPHHLTNSGQAPKVMPTGHPVLGTPSRITPFQVIVPRWQLNILNNFQSIVLPDRLTPMQVTGSPVSEIACLLEFQRALNNNSKCNKLITKRAENRFTSIHLVTRHSMTVFTRPSLCFSSLVVISILALGSSGVLLFPPLWDAKPRQEA